MVVAPEDAETFIAAGRTGKTSRPRVVAEVTAEPRLTHELERRTPSSTSSREFLNSNGARQAHATWSSPRRQPARARFAGATSAGKAARCMAADLNVCSQKGLCERFDSTIGAGTVLMPFGGAHQLTPVAGHGRQAPRARGRDHDLLGDGLGLQPGLVRRRAPTTARMLAVVESRVPRSWPRAASHEQCWLTFQEYFERTNGDPQRWGKPLAALLGALEAQMQLGHRRPSAARTP